MRRRRKIGCPEFCQDIWKDWDQHFNTKILHFSSAAKHSISKILKWRRFFIFWSWVKFCHLGKFLKEVGCNILWQSAFEEDDDLYIDLCWRWWNQYHDFEDILSSWKCLMGSFRLTVNGQQLIVVVSDTAQDHTLKVFDENDFENERELFWKVLTLIIKTHSQGQASLWSPAQGTLGCCYSRSPRRAPEPQTS